ncbi:neutral zinc metallopeptidase [Actinotalea sp.]|uniref:KPN_02809 family neutral zinc metallopeptidase n=1 Tax=Actinotalea sp. TaxID=1872145 RepID=UPI003564479E
MTFHEGGSFEGGRVQRRGRGRTVAAGGGIGLVGIAVLLLSGVLGVDLGPILGAVTGQDPAAQSDAGSGTPGTTQECTVEQANTERHCRLSAAVQSLDAVWIEQLDVDPDSFPIPDVVDFDSSTSTACGQASSSTGPFYCPPEQTIFLDLGFFDLLESRFGASGGPLAEMYVTAHEYGHHIQQITGVMDRADRSGTGADSDSVRLELQADCYAGLWVGKAATTIDPDRGVPFLEPVTSAELADALSAAAAVGDDHIQSSSGGIVNPDSWTHGSSEQRERWFMIGYEQGSVAACDTFATSAL